MKKTLMLILCIILAINMAIPAFASESTLVSLTLDETMEEYTLTIPDSIAIDLSEKSAVIDVTLSDVTLIWSNHLSVKVTAENAVDGTDGSHLVNSDNSDLKIHYTINNLINNQQNLDLSSGVRVASYTKGTAGMQDTSQNGKLKLLVDGKYPGAGTYTDTLTFTVTLS